MIDSFKVMDAIILRLYEMYDGGGMVVDRTGKANEVLGSSDARDQVSNVRTEWKQFVSPNAVNSAMIRPCVDISFPIMNQIDDTLRGAAITGASSGTIVSQSPYSRLEGVFQVMVRDERNENYQGAYSLAHRIGQQWPSGYIHETADFCLQVDSPGPRARGGFMDDTSFNVPLLVSFTATAGAGG